MGTLSTDHREWDAATYDRLSDPQFAWAQQILSQLALRGDERLLDVGCGSGRVTRLLVDRVPGGHVIGVDASSAMVARAREALGDEVELHCADILELELAAPVDVVFSNATLHWVPDHDALFARIRALLRPGGRLVAQCGGEGNVAGVHDAVRDVQALPRFASSFRGWEDRWRFAGASETEQRLRDAGFSQASCWLFDSPIELDEPRRYLAAVVVRMHLQRLPTELREPFMDELMARVGPKPTLDYVRLNIDARA